MSVSHYFEHIGTHFADLAGTPSNRRINTDADLLQATILAHQTTAARFDEHQRLLHSACTDLSALLVQVRNHPQEVLAKYRLWASL